MTLDPSLSSSSSSSSSLVGQEIAGFRLTSLLGEGGMATVYRGENLLDPSIVRAIKVVHRDLSERKEFVRRFAEEARLLEKLNHPNIVRFFGVRREQERLIMELELLEGRTLADMLKQWSSKPTPLATIALAMQQACEGVAAAHALSVAHRDLKPENLFVTSDGSLKVLDFGIARALDEADRENRLTVQGTIPGSPAYMAPEVCSGEVPTRGADVYALGVALYELVAGHHPFIPPGQPGKTSTQLMFAHVSQPIPPLREARPGVPEMLEQVVLRATAKKPEDRFPSAREMADALRAVVALLPPDPTPRTSAPKASLTEFALPEIGAAHAPGRTTAPAVLAGTRSQPPRQRGAPLIAAGLLSAALLAGVLYMAAKGPTTPHDKPAASTQPASHAPASASVSEAPPPPEKNRWVRIEPPAKQGYKERDQPVLLGVSSDKAPESVHGFRPKRGVTAPTEPYEIQQHEVTWEELDPWLAGETGLAFDKAASVPAEPAARAKLPAIGVPWETARAYCRSIGGSLPTEEQWEYAARGPDLRPSAWGSQSIDLMRTRALAGASASVAAIMTSDQDVTPGDEAHALYDMTGNAREWTADLYRSDLPSEDESWTQDGGRTYRAVRGLPLAEDLKPRPPELAAHRDVLCATGPCPPDTKEVLAWVGFRCARQARAAKGGAR